MVHSSIRLSTYEQRHAGSVVHWRRRSRRAPPDSHPLCKRVVQQHPGENHTRRTLANATRMKDVPQDEICCSTVLVLKTSSRSAVGAVQVLSSERSWRKFASQNVDGGADLDIAVEEKTQTSESSQLSECLCWFVLVSRRRNRREISVKNFWNLSIFRPVCSTTEALKGRLS